MLTPNYLCIVIIVLQYDAEIVYLENKERDQLQQIEAITREISKHDNIMRQGNEQVCMP